MTFSGKSMPNARSGLQGAFRPLGLEIVLQPLRALDAISGVGDGAKSFLGNLSTTLLAAAEPSFVKPLEGGLSLLKYLIFILKNSQRSFLLEGIAGQVSGVHRDVGQIATWLASRLPQGFTGYIANFAEQPPPQIKQSFPVVVKF